MLTELCQELHNWFDRERYTGTFTIEGGVLTASFLLPGQYCRIIGSVFNDGVWKHGAPQIGLKDETFEGAVWALAIPNEVLQLADSIQEWRDTKEAKLMGPFSSESLTSTGYSYQKMSASDLGKTNWQTVFASRLNAWRKI